MSFNNHDSMILDQILNEYNPPYTMACQLRELKTILDQYCSKRGITWLDSRMLMNLLDYPNLASLSTLVHKKVPLRITYDHDSKKLHTIDMNIHEFDTWADKLIAYGLRVAPPQNNEQRFGGSRQYVFNV